MIEVVRCRGVDELLGVFPVPSRLEAGGPSTARANGFTRSYWLYMVAGACFAAGLMSFELTGASLFQ